MKNDNQPKTDRVRVNRVPSRGIYDKETINQILDQGVLCHMGFEDKGQVFVIPMAYGRDEKKLYVHGSTQSRLIEQITSGKKVCITMTLLDGLVLARSAFHHSMNYQSVVLLSQGEVVEEPHEKLKALEVITDHIVPGRWEQVRHPNKDELQQTAVVSFLIDEASAKVRQGHPVDEEKDYQLKVWAGILPYKKGFDDPIPDPKLAQDALPLNIGGPNSGK